MARDNQYAARTWLWSGLDPDGKRVRRRKVVAPSQGAVIAALVREGNQPVEVIEQSTSGLNMTIGPEGVRWKYAQKAEFARRMHQMLRAGISVPQSLLSMAEDAKPPVAKMYTEIAEAVSAGRPFAAALADHPRTFDEVFIAYVAAGEESGTLQVTLGRLSTLLAKRAAMQSKIKGVMAYPKMVGGTILVLVFGIITFLVPTFADIYASFDAELPAPTRALVWVSDHMLPLGINRIEEPIPFFVPVPKPLNFLSFVIYIAVGWFVFRRKTKGNLEVGRKLDIIKFRSPVMGKLWHKSSLFQWASTLSGGLAAGVPLTRSLELAAAASGSDWQKLVSERFAEAVRTGRQVNEAMHAEPFLYPPSIRTMVATGEKTGEIDEMLDSASQSLDEEVESLVAGLSAKIEVALLLVLGVVVGGLLLVLYMPIIMLASTASSGLGGPAG